MSDNRELAQPDGAGFSKLRIWRTPKRGKRSAKIRVKCGCCNRSLDIYHDTEGIEINGVHASVAEWRRLLLPLLGVEQKPLPHGWTCATHTVNLHEGDALWKVYTPKKRKKK